MKTRIDFVTNSSSASFTVSKKGLSPLQIAILLNPELMKAKCPEWFHFCGSDTWTVTNKKTKIEFWTSMDNFDYRQVFDFLDIPAENIEGESDND